MTSYIGSTYLSESCTNSASWCSAACMDKHPSTCRISANRSPVSRRGNISAPPADDNWSCRATGSAPTAEGHLPWLVRRCGTLCLTIWEIRLLAVIASDARWKRFCLRRIETCSTFGVLRECAIQIYFYLLTYLLGHQVSRPRPRPRPGQNELQCTRARILSRGGHSVKVFDHLTKVGLSMHVRMHVCNVHAYACLLHTCKLHACKHTYIHTYIKAYRHVIKVLQECMCLLSTSTYSSRFFLTYFLLSRK